LESVKFRLVVWPEVTVTILVWGWKPGLEAVTSQVPT
jgi:hypothetical protein